MIAKVLMLVLCTATGACTVGLDSVLFVTKTGMGADLDSQPPTVDLGYSRKEAVIAPVFQDGEVLPVLTTIGAKNSIFNFVSDQSFATGDAALVMADALGKDVEYFSNSKGSEILDPWSTKSHTAEDHPGTIEAVKSSHSGFFGNLKYFFTGDRNRRRYAFGTDTSLGLQVGYNGANNLPRSLSLGWKRKEAAYVPLIETALKVEDGKPPKVEVRLASLIATAKGGAQASKDGKVEDTEQRVMQTYATGAAATLLAGHSKVREVLGEDLFEDYSRFKEEAGRTESQIDLVNQIKKLHGDSVATNQAKILATANDLFGEGSITDILQLDGVRNAQDETVATRLMVLRDYAKALPAGDGS